VPVAMPMITLTSKRVIMARSAKRSRRTMGRFYIGRRGHEPGALDDFEALPAGLTLLRGVAPGVE
jgi:hypothetical protein